MIISSTINVGGVNLPVTSIGYQAFASVTSLASATIPSSVTTIGGEAFRSCPSLTGVYFLGNAPADVGLLVFYYSDNVTVYYLLGTTGWTNPWQGRPTAVWTPQVQASAGNMGVRTNRFGFTSGLVVVVDACTNAASPVWSPVGANTLTGSSSYFSDAQWTNYRGRFYRLHWQQ